MKLIKDIGLVAGFLWIGAAQSAHAYFVDKSDVTEGGPHPRVAALAVPAFIEYFHSDFTYVKEYACTPVEIGKKKFAIEGYLVTARFVPAGEEGQEAYAEATEDAEKTFVIESPKPFANAVKAQKFCLNIEARLARGEFWRAVDTNTQDTYRGYHNVITGVTVFRAGETVNVLQSIRRDLVEVYYFPNRGFRLDEYKNYPGKRYMTNKKPKPVIL
ncbi:MAG TPA: hypothetical protein VM901_12960 [Bdellovibrionota bacterium]|jgi:hypothetical protein|nr:hypothetical protein [Bdellovibrionota bacterium]